MKIPLAWTIAALGAALCVVSGAGAQEVIRAGPRGAPPMGAVSGAAGVLDEAPSGPLGRLPLAARNGDMARAGCAPREDRKPHGEAWVGAGNRGYREAGAVVRAPIGDCGQVTIAVDKAKIEAPRYGWR